MTAEEPLANDQRAVVKCPACEDPLDRIGRTVLMRALIGSKRYYCWFCHQGYLSFLGRLLPPRG